MAIKRIKKIAKRVKRKVISGTADILSAKAQFVSHKARRKANEEVSILKNDRDNRKKGNWTGSETQIRTRRMADWIRAEHKRKKK